MKKIVICGGHLTPAIALIEGLETKKDVKIIFFGRQFSMEGNRSPSAEFRVITKKNIQFVKITSGRLQRKFTRYTIPSFIKIPIGFIQSFFHLFIIRPDVVVSFGGYLSTPVVFSAWLLGVDSVTHEQASSPGLANRINSLFVRKVFLTWQKSKKYFNDDKCEVIGNLTRSSLFKIKASDQKIANFIKKNKKLIFITGGNQGSHFLNTLARDLVPRLQDFALLHQVGTANYKNDLEKSKKIKSTNYMCVDYINPQDIGAVYKAAQIILSRSGANTVWDIAILAKVAIFIPLPNSASAEQMANAKILEDALCAQILKQDTASPQNVEASIRNVFKNLKTYEANAKRFSAHLPKNALSKVVNFLNSN